MKILMTNKFLYPNGGSETYMLKLGQALADRGHEVQYYGMEYPQNTVGNRLGLYAPNVDYHGGGKNPVTLAATALSTVYSRTAKAQMEELIRSFQPDVIHFNNINFQLTPSLYYAAKKYDVPMVQTVHDVQIACPCHRFYVEHEERICEDCKGGKYYYCLKNKCVQGSTLKSGLAALESYYYHTRDSYNLVDVYVCPSRFIAKKITEAGVHDSAIHVMHNFAEQAERPSDAVLAETLSSLDVGKPLPERYALYFGRLSREKGIGTLLQVAAELPQVNFVFAGSGPLEAAVREAAAAKSNVFFAGFQSGTALHALIAGADFTLYPSEWYENCPLSILESEALGTPVIGSDLGGTPELIEHGSNGLVFPGGNAEALQSAVRTLWEDNETLASMREACRKTDLYTLDRYTDDIIKLYNNLK